MIDNIDVDASPLIYGTKTIEELGQELLKLTQEVACGQADQGRVSGLYRDGHRSRVQLRVSSAGRRA